MVFSVSQITLSFNDQGNWDFNAVISPQDSGSSVSDDNAYHTVSTCLNAGSACSANSECCPGSNGNPQCEYQEDTGSYSCIDSCPSGFDWDAGTQDCVPSFDACYASDGSVSPSCSTVPEFGNTCGGTTSSEACCYETTEDGVDYGQPYGISSY